MSRRDKSLVPHRKKHTTKWKKGRGLGYFTIRKIVGFVESLAVSRSKKLLLPSPGNHFSILNSENWIHFPSLISRRISRTFSLKLFHSRVNLLLFLLPVFLICWLTRSQHYLADGLQDAQGEWPGRSLCYPKSSLSLSRSWSRDHRTDWFGRDLTDRPSPSPTMGDTFH